MSSMNALSLFRMTLSRQGSPLDFVEEETPTIRQPRPQEPLLSLLRGQRYLSAAPLFLLQIVITVMESDPFPSHTPALVS